MICKDIKTAIDSASRRNPLPQSARMHLDGCADCRGYSDEMNSLLSLLKAQPRVEAPSDFDFRVRARIARAKAEPKRATILEQLWSGAFSWGQTATAAAALGLVLTFVTYNYIHTDPNAIVQGVRTPAAAVTASTQQPAAVAATAVETAEPAKVIRAGARSARALPVIERSMAAREAEPAESTWRAYDSDRKQMVAAPNRSMLVGAESYATRTSTYVPSI